MTSEDSAARAVVSGVCAAGEPNDADAFVASYADQVSVTLLGTGMTKLVEVYHVCPAK